MYVFLLLGYKFVWRQMPHYHLETTSSVFKSLLNIPLPQQLSNIQTHLGSRYAGTVPKLLLARVTNFASPDMLKQEE